MELNSSFTSSLHFLFPVDIKQTSFYCVGKFVPSCVLDDLDLVDYQQFLL